MPSPRNVSCLLAVLLAAGCATAAPRMEPMAASPTLVDDVAAARERLEQQRAAVRDDRSLTQAERVRRMTALGMWEEAEQLVAGVTRPDAALRVALAELRMKQHRYREAGELVQEVLASNPRLPAARLAHARLQIQAWELPAAAATAQALLDERPRDEAAALVLGRIRLLEKDYEAALRWARQIQEWNPSNAAAYLLEADTRFWDQDPAGAEPPLVRALALDPFDPDARFAYGYAIWRRVDATQLDDMAAHWNLAFEVDPLHYITHWHYGNGHTHLTYADYVHASDSTVRVQLSAADSLIAADRIGEAIEATRRVEREFPESVLPAMMRGSAFYMAEDLPRESRLDSAQAIFRSVLARKPNYGPAHNGLAAVIKKRQFEVLASYDSLEAVIAATPTPTDPALEYIFPEIRYYPGDRVEKMVRQQLGPSIAYLPLIERQRRQYRIPPLHQDLAQAMGRAGLRTSTTFDNRQWMDIRGVGSGAAAIEYVERGSHQERNVLLHEFVHLFHGGVFTDAESRRVRELYHDAMREGRTLDYYASNNESEFLAQAYPAVLAPVKVHPLNHKAMNTHDDLLRKDPATYAFVDSLMTRQRAYLAGDTAALKSNWAQIYVNLSEQARGSGRGGRAAAGDPVALLDTALVWDAQYVPAMLSYASLQGSRGRFGEAERWLARAESLDPAYAPTYAQRAALVGARARAEGASAAGALKRQVALYREALRLERDLSERAQLNETLRELYLAHSRVPDAIAAAEEYVATAPTISTYLRDRRDEAAAFAHQLRSGAGYASESLPFFRELVGQKPQNYGHRSQFAEALLVAQRLDEALETLEEAQRILRAGGTASPDFAARLAEIHLMRGDTAAARAAVQPVLEAGDRGRADGADLRVVRVLAALGHTTEANRVLTAAEEGERSDLSRAEIAFTRGWMSEWRGDRTQAEQEYRRALALNPYHRQARLELMELLTESGRAAEAGRLADEAAGLQLPLGPDFRGASGR